jgi:hypothetical protein
MTPSFKRMMQALTVTVKQGGICDNDSNQCSDRWYAGSCRLISEVCTHGAMPRVSHASPQWSGVTVHNVNM